MANMISMYHASHQNNEDSILETGIKTGCDGCVYLAEKPEEAARFLAVRGIKFIAVFEVLVDKDKIEESFDHSKTFFKCNAYTIAENILPQNILKVFYYTV